MIVKHVTEALRRQDWVAVAIEFLLIVVGVLLAFQINEWASEREARAERQAATERLMSEAEEDVLYFEQHIKERQGIIADLSFALDRLQQGKWSRTDEARIRSGVTRSVYLGSPAPPSGIYDELVASGMLGQIGDPSLRSSIGVFQSKVADLSRLFAHIEQIAPQLDREESIWYSYDATGSRPARLDIDFAALQRDRKLKSSLALMNDRQWFILWKWKDTLASARLMCGEIGRTIGKRCEHRAEGGTL